MNGDSGPAGAPQRLVTLDAVRGFAVMGILLLNIIDFAMPSYAYVDPHYYGGASGTNWWAWALVYALADGKMRGLFTMLFGASTVLIAEQAARAGRSPARVHYARLAVLFALGMVHAYLIWAGDILVLYSVAGALVFLARRWRVRLLVTIGVVLLGFQLANGIAGYQQLHRLEMAAAAPGADAATVAEWQRFEAAALPPPGAAQEELAAYRGSYREALRERVKMAWLVQSVIDWQVMPDTLALMLIGMALFRTGFFSGAWPRRWYQGIAVWGAGVTIPLYVPLVMWLEATGFSPVTQVATEAIQLTLLRPVLSLAYAATIILWVTRHPGGEPTARLAAAGRMAFSNYLGTSIVCTLIFNGYGLGWFGYLERWECYLVVLGVWAAMLLWSKPWLDRFLYGPLEWVWRSLARGRLQPMRRDRVANATQ